MRRHRCAESGFKCGFGVLSCQSVFGRREGSIVYIILIIIYTGNPLPARIWPGEFARWVIHSHERGTPQTTRIWPGEFARWVIHSHELNPRD